ncbi:beta-taxilin-like [Euwallacea fornicatus]|uniref:beta-taxilin-like n=1 Tax=Euwallacea fornicatus TaxID=995702 RepID=UPI00338EB4B0
MSEETGQAEPPLVVFKRKKDEKYRKRDPRAWENLMKATVNMSPEEKRQHLETVYKELYNENRTCNANLQAREKQHTQCLKEREKDRAELSKSILARGQLESLCRELQKQNKLIKEENVARIKEEEDRRKEVANSFSDRLNALTSLITESKDKSNKVKEENQTMTQTLSELYGQYRQRENHLETVSKQLDLQKKLSETQIKKLEIEHEAERQTFMAEKKTLLLQLEQYEKELLLLQEKNRSLEAQVDLYKSQYNDFEATMSKSNKVFDTFKKEMVKMNGQLHALESERNDLKKRWQSSVNSLITLSEQHVALAKEQGALEKKLVMLQKLCRQLQEDRGAFLRQLKENNIEPVVPAVLNGDSSTNDQEKDGVMKGSSNGQKNGKKEKPPKIADDDSDRLSKDESCQSSPQLKTDIASTKGVSSSSGVATSAKSTTGAEISPPSPIGTNWNSFSEPELSNNSSECKPASDPIGSSKVDGQLPLWGMLQPNSQPEVVVQGKSTPQEVKVDYKTPTASCSKDHVSVFDMSTVPNSLPSDVGVDHTTSIPSTYKDFWNLYMRNGHCPVLDEVLCTNPTSGGPEKPFSLFDTTVVPNSSTSDIDSAVKYGHPLAIVNECAALTPSSTESTLAVQSPSSSCNTNSVKNTSSASSNDDPSLEIAGGNVMVSHESFGSHE